MNVDVFDPWASNEEVKNEYGIELISKHSSIKKIYDAVILAVSHKEFLTLDIEDFVNGNHVTFDVKSILPKEQTDTRL